MWKRFLKAIGLEFPVQSLRDIDGPTKVQIRGKVASGNAQQSPVSGMQAAAFDYILGEVVTIVKGTGLSKDLDQILARACVSDDLVIDCEDGRVLVPQGSFKLWPFDYMPPSAVPVTGTLPEQVMHVLERERLGKLIFHEDFVRQGDAVELRGVVAPIVQHTGYRSPGQTNEHQGARWVVVEGGATLVDKSLEEV